MDVKSDEYDLNYKNKSLLPSSDISIIISYMDEWILKDISILCLWDSILIESPPGIFFRRGSD